MIMWIPSENTSAYAYHIQVSTSDEPVRQWILIKKMFIMIGLRDQRKGIMYRVKVIAYLRKALWIWREMTTL